MPSSAFRRGLVAVVLLAVAACADRPDAPAITRTIPIAPGEVCAAGGLRIETGIDHNRNHLLDDAEVDAIDYVCNGVDGVAPIVVVTPEAAGEHCPLGGQRVEAGLDADGDGELDPGERTSVAWICSVERALVHLTPEPPGANCAGGGMRVDAGIDDDRDGILDPGEVDSTAWQCVLLPCVDDDPCGPVGFCVSGYCYTDPALFCGSSALPGDGRPCEKANGYGTCAGVETCDGTYWTGCNAPTPDEERCGDGIDNDCDGLLDGADTCVETACTAGERVVIQDCLETCAPTNTGCVTSCLADGQVASGCMTALMQLYVCMAAHSCAILPSAEEVLLCAANECPDETQAVFGGDAPKACTPDAVEPCGYDVGACVPGSRTCDATGRWGECVGAVGPFEEECNGEDDDCNGLVDDNPVSGGSWFFVDEDRDGFGSEPIVACQVSIGDPGMPYDIVDLDGDCQDWNPEIRPDADPICEFAMDANCDLTPDYLQVPDCYAGGCGDGFCDPALSEDPSTCLSDCTPCGDGTCAPGEGEDPRTCPADCPAVCGNGTCESSLGETEGNCPSDCLACSGVEVACPGGCADLETDPANCGDCGQSCGAGACVSAICVDVCGNGICTPEAGEHSASCPDDCVDVCGNGICTPEAGENPASCPDDCEDVCGDWFCGPTEDEIICPEDCLLP